ncbi:MAG: 23S rRNA 2'-O-ribose methyltransferase [Candidatus Westeberhardia cardiocondylae]|nr:23S rRNA 2'-O-ribose methyltransferase [Candidatus Westeberhardia cardiocondylae]
MGNRSLNSSRWLQEHINDTYVKQAKIKKLRSRSWFKIQDIQRSDRLFYPGMVIIELGSSPGGWSKYILSKIGDKGSIIACDIISMSVMKGVDFIQGDIYNTITIKKIFKKAKNKNIQLILSDISHNLSGIAVIDIAKSIYLVKFILKNICSILVKGGDFLVKIFQGEGFEECVHEIRLLFEKVKIRKPVASRSRSREVYIVAKKKR